MVAPDVSSGKATTNIPRRFPTSQFLLGALVTLVGVMLLLTTTGVFPTRDVLLYVPSLFVGLGIWALVLSRFRSLVGPVVLVGVAGARQLVALGHATVGQVVVYLPILVIAVGLSIILGQYRASVSATDDAFTSAFVALGGFTVTD